MRTAGVEIPRIHRRLLRGFAAYTDFYLRRNFHAIRLSKQGRPADPAAPVVIVMNHPSWWDPLIALALAMRFFPDRNHYAPIDAAALQKYAFFSKIGFFGIEPGTARGAGTFLRVGEAILGTEHPALWVTAQGTFADPRVRPVALRGGVAALMARVPGCVALPLAIEYPFWEEKHPEALAYFGAPVVNPDQIAPALEQAQDALAVDALSRDPGAFDIVAAGRSGVGGIYDYWRFLKSAVRGERFHSAHGTEHF